MNDIFAKVSSMTDRGIYKILSNVALFDPLELSDESRVSYTPTYKLDDDEWFAITEFSTRRFSLDIFEDEFVSIDYSQMQRNNFDKISFIFSVQDDDFYFQKIISRQTIRKAKALEIGAPARIQEITNSFFINNFPDAVYFKEKDVLVFKSLERISSIFKGIDTLYREATNEETDEFLGNSFIVLRDGYCGDKVKKANRKRIAMIIDKVNDMNEEEKEALLYYIAGYCESLKFDKEKMQFEVSNEDDLKQLLNGISENYYTTAVSKEKRMANSTLTID